MRRPATIIWFEGIYLASLLVGLALAIADATAGQLTGVLAARMAVLLLLAGLVLLVSRRRSNAARWLLIVFLAFVFLSLAWVFYIGEPMRRISSAFAVAATHMVALGLLFLPSAREWLTMRRRLSEAELNQTFE